MIVNRARTLHDLASFVVPTFVHIGNGHAFDIRKCQRLLEQLLPSPARADQADADAIVRSEHSIGRTCQPRRAAGGDSKELAAIDGLLNHIVLLTPPPGSPSLVKVLVRDSGQLMAATCRLIIAVNHGIATWGLRSMGSRLVGS